MVPGIILTVVGVGAGITGGILEKRAFDSNDRARYYLEQWEVETDPVDQIESV